jgi:hypothetical protein
MVIRSKIGIFGIFLGITLLYTFKGTIFEGMDK